jgi:membrane-bound metal-dependent hydrolase YbcI (DUF457 family)
MPFTLFHLGPGAALKAVARSRFSFAVFCCAQIVTDLEPVYYDLRGQEPAHRWLHTFLGATVVGGFCALISRPLGVYWGKLSGRPVILAWSTALGSALIGTYSHVFLDSIMHQDIMPFRPMTTANPLLHAIGTDLLHVLCAALGVLGAFLLLRASNPTARDAESS